MELAGDTPEMGTGAAAAAGGNECGAGPRGDTPVGLGDGTGSMIPSSFGEGYLSPLGDSGGTSSSRAYLMGAGAAGAQRAGSCPLRPMESWNRSGHLPSGSSS